MSQPLDCKLLTRIQLAEILGVSLPTVDRRCREGALPFIRLGPRQIRFLPADVEGMLSRLRVGQHPGQGMVSQ
ncbi:MAG: helix-turn-helix domain-containing protein [Verrucomicrobia bacterium]|nr:helix-turn-helix domain-containing protein [Verrucomicrobiota bacterium]MBU4247486.1 helix-turn-helix domain-containing protein [Verrucomicrobiota bacterium]MBU4292317.1 helix-turn-helix domain-containing protein [Verrucomicrobiota bacterium]MBU4497085.1 helix-turn-helix domain-containing protein [Verrucomicrobiota bacterium]MCG2678571.1 helix-turn-helix domain-containing protein [Kiritimatiellia bacterium]